MTIAIGVHDHKQGTTLSTSIATLGVTTQVSGSTFLIGVVAAGTSNITAVGDNKTNAYAQIGTQFNTSFGSCIAWYRKENGVGGAGHTVNATLGTGNVATIYFVEITGAALSSVLDQSVAFVGDASSPFTTNTTGTTSQADEIAIALYATDTPSGTETITWGNGFAQIDADGNSAFVTGGIAFKVLSATGTVQGSITSSVATDTAGAVATFKAAAGGGVTVALTNAAATFSAGSLTPSTAKALTNALATFSAGTITAAPSIALTNAAATWSAGSLTPSTAKALTNALATFSAGTLTPGTSVSLTNALATWGAGTISVSGSGDVTVALTNAAATWAAGNLTPSTTVALSNGLATWSAGSIVATPTVGLTNAAATFSAGNVTPALSVPLTNALATFSAGNVGIGGDITVALTSASATFSAGNMGVAGTAPPLFVGGGPTWFKQYPLLKDRKKKLPPVLKLEHVTVIPQEEPDYEVFYKYVSDVGPQLTELQAQMTSYKEAVAKAIALNEEIKKSKRNNQVIMLAILYE